MELTSTSFFVTLNIVTFLMVLTTLFLWGKVRGPGWVRWPLRTGLIVLCQLTAIATVATVINNDYGLYASWDDLLGTENGGTGNMTGPPATRAKFSPANGGVRTTYFRGERSRLAGEVLVSTPPGYDEAARRTTHYPVVMLLHGVPGSPQTWLDRGGMPGRFRDLVGQGLAHEAILVMPIVDPGGVDTDCTDLPHRRTATWIASDVTDLISRNFRTLPSPRGWGLMGLSTGGYCAARLPLQFPDKFAAGAALDPDPLTGDPDVVEDARLRARTSPMGLLRAARTTPLKPSPALFLATSKQDPDSPPSYIDRFREDAAGTGVEVATDVVPRGGHNWNTWQGMYPKALPWLDGRLDAPRKEDQGG
ncbi:alpha/beta hydrolase [Streptomyces beihaiensis]|uniref:Alpha/beta hydrolase-fold protein n=1 Tax=Streptomyces beihaiensis TaxID=2984495 RepID=A0ABT3TVX0_9ACTN|nr:alpha/beta hydrolase-fold protein [Streptomyces beihaiensis]MCX3060930.1 alpha/beta hydrolase-fold protein [Streptomyces beihaiensis]